MSQEQFISQDPSKTEELMKSVKEQRTSSRRHFLAQAGLAGLGVMAAGQLGASAQSARLSSVPGGFDNLNDTQILNFALNLEYLEAEFYVRAAFGTTLGASDISGRGNNGNSTTPGTVTGVSSTPAGDQVPFANTTQDQIIRQYAEEIATDELTHVRLLRGALGSAAVARPTLDIGPAFTVAAQAAGVITSTQTFNPYADSTSFLLGAFIFEDVGVTAYRGALSLLSTRANISVAGGLLGVEAYHASEVRTVLFGLASSTDGGSSIIDAVQKISNLRDGADGTVDDDQGITNDDTDQNATVGTGVVGAANIVPTDANGLVYARNLRQVLNIVYLNGSITSHSGGFFPNGLNGRVR